MAMAINVRGKSKGQSRINNQELTRTKTKMGGGRNGYGNKR
jgi:hypothetical protein